jgi:hypothetical protein
MPTAAHHVQFPTTTYNPSHFEGPLGECADYGAGVRCAEKGWLVVLRCVVMVRQLHEQKALQA